jgi:hypothetical protein
MENAFEKLPKVQRAIFWARQIEMLEGAAQQYAVQAELHEMEASAYKAERLQSRARQRSKPTDHSGNGVARFAPCPARTSNGGSNRQGVRPGRRQGAPRASLVAKGGRLMKSEFDTNDVLRFVLQVRNRLRRARASAHLAAESVPRGNASRAQMVDVADDISGAVRALDNWADALEREILARQEAQKGPN